MCLPLLLCPDLSVTSRKLPLKARRRLAARLGSVVAENEGERERERLEAMKLNEGGEKEFCETRQKHDDRSRQGKAVKQ